MDIGVLDIRPDGTNIGGSLVVGFLLQQLSLRAEAQASRRDSVVMK